MLFFIIYYYLLLCRSEQLLCAWNAGTDHSERQEAVSVIHAQWSQQDRRSTRGSTEGLTTITTIIVTRVL